MATLLCPSPTRIRHDRPLSSYVSSYSMMSSYNGRKRMRLLDTDCCTSSAVYNDVDTDGSCGFLSWGTNNGITASPLISSSSSSSSQRPKKRVRFSTPLKQDDEEVQVRTSSSINAVVTNAATTEPTATSSLTSTEQESSTATEQEQQEDVIFDPRLRRKELWWTKEERSQILDECRTIGRAFKETHSDAVQDYLDLYEDECCNGTLPSIHDDNEEEDDDDDDSMPVTPLFPTHVRGLEWCVVPSTRSHRKVHVQDILHKQADLQRAGRDMRSMILSRRSIQSSKASRLLAHYTGQMDAISALSDKC